jgi:hypothetical protein
VQYTSVSSDTANSRSYDGVKIGMSDTSLAYFDGSIDEVRISDTARSAGWIATEYNNQSQPLTFHKLGGEETNKVSKKIQLGGTIKLFINPSATQPLVINNSI